MENNIQKINTLGKVGDIICKILKVILVIGAVVCFVCGILMCFVPRDAVKLELSSANTAIVHLNEKFDIIKKLDLDLDDETLKIGEHSYQIVDDGELDLESHTLYLSDVKWVLFAGILACAAAWVFFHYAGKLCACFRYCTTPFTEEASKGLTRLAWSLVPMAVVGSLMEGFAGAALLGDGDVSVSVNLETVFAVLCLFLLSYVFKHGTALQTQADETL